MWSSFECKRMKGENGTFMKEECLEWLDQRMERFRLHLKLKFLSVQGGKDMGKEGGGRRLLEHFRLRAARCSSAKRGCQTGGFYQ